MWCCAVNWDTWCWWESTGLHTCLYLCFCVCYFLLIYCNIQQFTVCKIVTVKQLLVCISGYNDKNIELIWMFQRCEIIIWHRFSSCSHWSIFFHQIVFFTYFVCLICLTFAVNTPVEIGWPCSMFVVVLSITCMCVIHGDPTQFFRSCSWLSCDNPV